MLNKMADFYEDEAATRSTQTGLVVGVLLGLLVAVYIGYVVISFYMGYYAPMGEELKG
jgi:type II secretory pathway component PulF